MNHVPELTEVFKLAKIEQYTLTGMVGINFQKFRALKKSLQLPDKVKLMNYLSNCPPVLFFISKSVYEREFLSLVFLSTRLSSLENYAFRRRYV